MAHGLDACWTRRVYFLHLVPTLCVGTSVRPLRGLAARILLQATQSVAVVRSHAERGNEKHVRREAMPKSAIVVVVDRLGCGCLGPYGCTWVDTPNFNTIAARSLLIENMLADSPELSSAYRAYFAGRHVLESDDSRDVDSAVRAIAGASAATTLVTDDADVAELPAADAFVERLLLSADAPTSSAKAIEDTALAKLFAAAIDQLHAQQDPFLLWVHTQGMNAPWDAPPAMRPFGS